MTTFVDTSAFFALLDADDASHSRAATWFGGSGTAQRLVTHNYVVVETAALVDRRLGRQASAALFDGLLPVVDVAYVDQALHTSAVRGWLVLGAGRSSLVDWVSFELIERRGIDQAFAFDGDFLDRGIPVVP